MVQQSDGVAKFLKIFLHTSPRFASSQENASKFAQKMIKTNKNWNNFIELKLNDE